MRKNPSHKNIQQANEFCQTALYRKYADKIGFGNLYDIATCLWYGYIDLSKYFMGDQNDWDNLNGAHFEREFYRETFDQIKRIIFGETYTSKSGKTPTFQDSLLEQTKNAVIEMV